MLSPTREDIKVSELVNKAEVKVEAEAELEAEVEVKVAGYRSDITVRAQARAQGGRGNAEGQHATPRGAT